MVFLIPVAVIVGLIPAVIAHRKGHPFALWWVFGALLFVVALPAALIIRTTPTARAKSKLRNRIGN